jgi:hypothetical protein
VVENNLDFVRIRLTDHQQRYDRSIGVRFVNSIRVSTT